MVKDTDLYLKLGVNSNATQQEIQNNYWSIVKTLQPAEVEDSKKLVEITDAYNVLKDPVLRRKYDVEGRHGFGVNQSSPSGSKLIVQKFQYFCYDLSTSSQMSREREPLIIKGQNLEHGFCFRALTWIAAVFLFIFIFAALSYLLFLED